MKLHLVSLGCAKNLVDSEIMMGRLIKAGWAQTPHPEKADIIIVNTCSFIESAVNESIDTILELARYKQAGACRRLIVAGCLPERFREKIVESLPEVDLFLGTGAFDEIVKAASGSLDAEICCLPDPNSITFRHQESLRIRSSAYMAYLKLSEGCNRHCTYCIIPKLRGKQRSRDPEDILAEARSLISSGVKELILVAQDTTHYGSDLQPPVSLSRLIGKISELSDGIWIRILYGHPESIDENVIRTIAEHRNVCSYFDIPIQHASNRILKKMGRNYLSDDLRRLFDNIRASIPDAALRTTAIVGFPGETDEDFKKLLRFTQDICFDHLGVFTYSDAEDLPSHSLHPHIPENVAMDRYNRLMSAQEAISSKNNRKHRHKVYDVLVEGTDENNRYIGRTFFQAPEVDGITQILSRQLPIGSFVRVKIEDTFEYDLAGKVV
ncbi:MAG: 30S ribosomal protein S12 methylthiotransferase RimO [Deltaproteobacteria bacterium]|nr:30S ribosomal protein S12 methylthiotransferase RimO [Deltaproteobacteria bacterium]MBW2227303.1 30S ribosomal protein S12 methylthiotransferase RimO [Deltaproteobacteria bacterium]